MSSDKPLQYDNGLQYAIEQFVYNTLISREINTNILPGLSLKSDNKEDPLHEHFIRGFSSGLQKFLKDDTTGQELWKSLSPKGILQNIGLTDTWLQSNDIFRNMLYQSALNVAEKAIQQSKSMATLSEIKYAMKQATYKFRHSLENGDFTFGHIIAHIRIVLKDKQVTTDLFWAACREINIPVPSENFQNTIFLPDDFYPEPGPIPKNKIPKSKITLKAKIVCGILAGIVVFVASLFAILDSQTFKNIASRLIHLLSYSQSVSDPNVQVDSNTTIQPSNPINDKSKPLPDTNSPNAPSTP